MVGSSSCKEETGLASRESGTKPTLILVTGPPASGKTTLAHALSRAIPCPVISRDEIKEGIVFTDGGGKPEWGGPVAKRTFEAFFGVLRLLLDGGVTVIAEAAFKNGLWQSDVMPLREVAKVRVVQCAVDEGIGYDRLLGRLEEADPARISHPDSEVIEAFRTGTMTWDDFDEIAGAFPSLRVDTTAGYIPPFDEIVAFASQRKAKA